MARLVTPPAKVVAAVVGHSLHNSVLVISVPLLGSPCIETATLQRASDCQKAKVRQIYPCQAQRLKATPCG